MPERLLPESERKHVHTILITRSVLVGLVVTFLLIGIAFVGLAYNYKQLTDERNQTQQLAVATHKLAIRNCRQALALRSLLVGVALNQPNLDPRLLNVLNKTLSKFPGTCS